MGIGLIVTILPYSVLKSDSRETQSPWTQLLLGNVAYERPLTCYLVSNLNRARFWLHAGNHNLEPVTQIDPNSPVQKSARFRMDTR